MKPTLKIILAVINGSPELDNRQAIRLKKTCKELGLEQPVNVNTVDELIDVLGSRFICHKSKTIYCTGKKNG